MIIDDDPSLLIALTASLEIGIEGAIVEAAGGADTALLMMAAIPYDVVISDFVLPGIKGFGLLKEARRLRPQTPIIVITGHGDLHLQEEGAHQGVYAFLHKPISAHEFVAVVSRALGLRSSTREKPPPGEATGVDAFSFAAQRLLEKARQLKNDVERKLEELRDPDESP